MPAILISQAWSEKNLLYRERTLSSCGTQRVVLNKQIPTWVANHIAGLSSSFPRMELVILIKPFPIWLCLARTVNYQIRQYGWLKSVLIAV